MASNTGSSKRGVRVSLLGLAHFYASILWKNSFNVKYLGNGDRYHDGVKGSRI